MPEYFQTKVKYLKQQDNGLIKAVTEQYLVDALSFTEVEARLQLEKSEGQRELSLVSITRSNIREVVIYGDSDLWFRVKITYSAADEESEKEKKITLYILVNASDVPEAEARAQDHLKDMLVPFKIPQVTEWPIVEVFQHLSGLRHSMNLKRKEETAKPITLDEYRDLVSVAVCNLLESESYDSDSYAEIVKENYEDDVSVADCAKSIFDVECEHGDQEEE